MSVQNSFKKVGVKDSFLNEVFYPSTFDAVINIFAKEFPDQEIIFGNERKFSGQYGIEITPDTNGHYQINDEIYSKEEKPEDELSEDEYTSYTVFKKSFEQHTSF